MNTQAAILLRIEVALSKMEKTSQLAVEKVAEMKESTQMQAELVRQMKELVTKCVAVDEQEQIKNQPDIKLSCQALQDSVEVKQPKPDVLLKNINCPAQDAMVAASASTAQAQPVPPTKVPQNPLKTGIHAFPVQDPPHREIEGGPATRTSNCLYKFKAWPARTFGNFPSNVQHPSNDGADIQLQMDESTGGEVVEDSPQNKPRKNNLQANTCLGAPVISGIHFPTDESTGGEAVEDAAPQQKPRKKLINPFHFFGASSSFAKPFVKLFRKKRITVDRKSDIAGFLSGSKPMSERFSQTYALGRLLGEGAFGFVMTATRLRDNMQVAVKFINTDFIPRSAWLPDPSSPHGERVPPEIAILQQIRHPYVIQYIDHLVECKPYALLITELHGSQWALPQSSVGSSSSSSTVLGDESTPFDLCECIMTQQHLAEPVARKVFAQVLLAVKHLQTQGIVHRDIKHDNIVVDSNFAVKIIDFGCAAWIPKSQLFTQFCGTIPFASPEMLRNEAYRGPEVEIWALGVLLYTMVFGELPFLSEAETIEGHLIWPDGFCLDSDNDYLKSCRYLIRRMLDYCPESRLTIDEVLEHAWVKAEVEIYQNGISTA